MKLPSLLDLDLVGKKVLMRVDFNTPLDPSGQISDDTRIQAAIPSIEYILNKGGKLILMSHLGKPDGKVDLKYSLAVCAKRLSEKLKKPVEFASDCIGPEVKKKIDSLQNGCILLLENLRFHPGEESPETDPSFEKELASLGDCYVNDAFGTCHRAHASTTTIAKYFPGRKAAGFLIEKEIQALKALYDHPEHPYLALIGGSKISSKLGVLKSLLTKVDSLFIGGGMAFTFLYALGFQVGDSILELKMVEEAKKLLGKVILPLDIVIANSLDAKATTQTIDFPTSIPDGYSGVDIGPKTIKNWQKYFEKAKTFFWNGPVGIFEIAPFAKGTTQIAQILAHTHAKVVIGGGDSVAAIEKMGLANRFYHLSTGGGASLELLEFRHLPGIDALLNE